MNGLLLFVLKIYAYPGTVASKCAFKCAEKLERNYLKATNSVGATESNTAKYVNDIDSNVVNNWPEKRNVSVRGY